MSTAITDSDVTSFVQDRNLIRRIDAASARFETKPIFRAIIVNRAEGDEELFRIALTREFPVTMTQTYPLPLDLEVLKAYKTQQSPYVAMPGSHFVAATLKVFREIMSLVTASNVRFMTPSLKELLALNARYHPHYGSSI